MYVAIFPEFFLILSISLILTYLVVLDYINKFKIILIHITGLVLIVIYFLYLILLNNNNFNFISFNNLLNSGVLVLLIKNILIITIVCCILISFNYLRFENIIKYEYFILLGFASLGILTVISSNDLISFYIAIEIQSLAFYVLSAIKVHNNFSTEAGLKYFILGAFSSGLLLFGCSFVYGSLGTTNFNEIRLLISNFSNNIPKTFVLGIIFIIISLLFKIGAAPFHMWLPDVYEGVPTILTLIYTTVPKIAILGLFLKLSASFLQNDIVFVVELLSYSAVLSIIIGTLGALYQTKLKRLLAYSAISHIGFILIGFISFNIWSIFSLFFYIITYIMISLNIFSVLLTIRKADNNLRLKKINEFAILVKSNPLLALNFGLVLFSIAGIPPLVGFYTKWLIFISAIKSEIFLISIIAALFSVIAALYYIRLIKLMFFKNFNYWNLFLDLPQKEAVLISLIFIFNLLFFCYPEFIIIILYNIIEEFFFNLF